MSRFIQKLIAPALLLLTFTSLSAAELSVWEDEEAPQKVAILPVNLMADVPVNPDELSYRIQLESYNLAVEKAKNIDYLSPTTVNALLLKKGVTRDNIKEYTIEELCDLLGVSYVMENVTTIYVLGDMYSSESTTGTSGGQKSKTVNTTVMPRYSTTVVLNIYDSQGKRIYGKDRESMWPTLDGYKKTLQYLIKRTPLYKK